MSHYTLFYKETKLHIKVKIMHYNLCILLYIPQYKKIKLKKQKSKLFSGLRKNEKSKSMFLYI